MLAVWGKLSTREPPRRRRNSSVRRFRLPKNTRTSSSTGAATRSNATRQITCESMGRAFACRQSHRNYAIHPIAYGNIRAPTQHQGTWRTPAAARSIGTAPAAPAPSPPKPGHAARLRIQTRQIQGGTHTGEGSPPWPANACSAVYSVLPGRVAIQTGSVASTGSAEAPPVTGDKPQDKDAPMDTPPAPPASSQAPASANRPAPAALRTAERPTGGAEAAAALRNLLAIVRKPRSLTGEDTPPHS